LKEWRHPSEGAANGARGRYRRRASNCMLGPGLTKPHRETSGLGRGRGRECGSRAAWCRPDTEVPLMRVYIIDADGLIVSPEPPAEPGENEIVVA
jgi:hypothetical protein